LCRNSSAENGDESVAFRAKKWKASDWNAGRGFLPGFYGAPKLVVKKA
jgi:hypothetical protein